MKQSSFVYLSEHLDMTEDFLASASREFGRCRYGRYTYLYVL